jgi:hypothetical protein
MKTKALGWPNHQTLLSLLVFFAVFAGWQLRAQATCVTPSSSLVGWWRGEGDATDYTGNNNGMLSNGVTFITGEVG